MHASRNGKPHILMCPPVHYEIRYAINPWMKALRPSDRGEATRQWEALRDLLRGWGAEIDEMASVEGLPDLVFTANAAIIYERSAILSRFVHPERQGEQEPNRNMLRDLGFDLLDLPPGQYFEGAGDALFCGDTLFAGYRMRSDAAGHQAVAALLGVRVIPLELVCEKFYHLDTCFCPLSKDTAIYFPGAFDDYGRRALEEHVPNRIAVDSAEAENFACNAVVVGKSVATNIGCPRLHTALREAGFDPQAVDLSEFLKAGGSAKCLTLRLDGEDAAQWKNRS